MGYLLSAASCLLASGLLLVAVFLILERAEPGPSLLPTLQLGVGIEDQARRSMAMGQRELSSSSWRSLFASAWKGWTAFEGWQPSSINFILGGSSSVVPKAVPAVAAWVALAVLLYLGAATVRRRRSSWQVPAVLFMVGWALLDLRWQMDMLRQVQNTRQQYAGKSWEQKHRASEDGALFALIQQVKEVLPPEPQRVFLVTDRTGRDNYLRLRSTYHLLPHNVFATGDRLPKRKFVRVGDYFLLLTGALDARYDPEGHALVGPGGTLPVARVWVGAQGALYRAR